MYRNRSETEQNCSEAFDTTISKQMKTISEKPYTTEKTSMSFKLVFTPETGLLEISSRWVTVYCKKNKDSYCPITCQETNTFIVS